jgi:peptidoglycan hydrolase-like protein with peptidoglycan-binding domain
VSRTRKRSFEVRVDMSRARVFLTALAGAAIVVVAVVSVLVVGLALQARAAQEPADREEALVMAAVTSDVLADEVSGRVDVQADSMISVTASGVVTRAGSKAGVPVVENGAVLATVDESPIFALEGDVPIYRHIAHDSVGADVLQLQTALNAMGYNVGPLDGVYGDATAEGVYAFLVDHDATPVDDAGGAVDVDPARTTVPRGQFVFVPGFPAVPMDQCGAVGEVIDGPLCMLAAQPSSVTLEVALVDAERLETGMRVETDIEGIPTATLGPRLQAEEQGEEGESEVASLARFAVDIGDATDPAPGTDGTGRVIIAASAPGALRIEGAAVRDPEGDGRPVLLLDTGAEVEIDLDICASGYCTFLSDSVTEGTKVVLSGRLPTDG